MPRSYTQKLGARSYKDFMDENLKKAVKACMKAGVYGMLVIYMVLREILHNALKGKLQNPPGGMTVFSQTKEVAFLKHLMVVSEWYFPMDEMNV